MRYKKNGTFIFVSLKSEYFFIIKTEKKVFCSQNIIKF